MSRNLKLDIPEKLAPLTQSARYKVAYGGRGGAKSWFYSDLAIIQAYREKLFFPCLRQFQVSMRDSVHKLLCQSISKMGLDSFYTITENKITGNNGSEFVFKGLSRNLNNIKSLEGADRAWITEAVDVTEEAWKKLIPTIRKPGSEIWIDFNPEEEEDPTYQRFVVHPPKDCILIETNYPDNPFFPEVLRQDMEYDKEYNEEEYDNIWLGKCRRISAAQIMRNKWEIQEFNTPDDASLNFGSDWGNTGTADPDCIIRFFIKDGCIYIDYEAWGHVEVIEDYVPFYNSMPDIKRNEVICDSTMEKFRKYLNVNGFCLRSAKKGAGSVEKGINFIRSFKKIYIHPRCKHTIFEFKNYRYKTDKLTGEVLPLIIDKHNHLIDSLRYALERHGQRSQAHFI